MRPGTRPAGSTNRRGRPRRWWARSTVGQAAGAGRPGGGSGASPSAARSRRTAWGSVTAPRIRRRPPQRSHTSTAKPNTRKLAATLPPQAVCLLLTPSASSTLNFRAA